MENSLATVEVEPDYDGVSQGDSGGGSGLKARCCWCRSRFVRIGKHFWCTSPTCRERQASHSVLAKGSDGSNIFLHVPLPRQVEFDACLARYLLGGGAAGSTKSHQARWGLYRRALAIEDYEGLLLRRTWGELEKHHFRLMAREAEMFRGYGIGVTFSITNREMTFHDTGSVIEGGHMENAVDIEKYLSRERDEIVCDEGSTFDPKNLLELSTRARSTKPQVLATGSRGLFRVYSNPGGAASSMLNDFFIDHEPDWEKFPEKLREDYWPEEWVYIPGHLEDNPYLPESYERDLAVLQPWRYQQLRHNDWKIISGLFFTEFAASTHVMDLGDPGDNCEWFCSMDWGYVNPGCILWWACLPDGRYYIRHEFKFSHLKIPGICHEFKERSLDAGVTGSSLRYIAADPSLWQPDKDTGEDMNETFGNNGMVLTKSNNDRVNGWQRCRELLGIREDGNPTVILHPDCKYLTRSLAQATSARHNPEDIGTEDDHALDAFRYGAMSRPSPTRIIRSTSTKTFKAQQARILKFKKMLRARGLAS